METRGRIAQAVQSVVDAGQLAGAVTLVRRGGEVAHHAAVGWRDIEAGATAGAD